MWSSSGGDYILVIQNQASHSLPSSEIVKNDLQMLKDNVHKNTM